MNRRVVPNPMKRYLPNNRSKLHYGKDDAFTHYFAPERPKDAPEGNWLPTDDLQQVDRRGPDRE